ncbi:MAG: RNase adapter RapZ [Candidatus Ancillula sp.]|jgi:UPF0042 nucleotide-binding protein|nr:RNase adapter RapZ [Candidatus Ancillula sp.]
MSDSSILDSNQAELLIITGLSGAGRSHVASVLEDEDWFVIDNLPPKMILPITDIAFGAGSSINKIAVVIDVRSRKYFADLDSILDELREKKICYRIIFLDASNEELIRRYEQVRRPHPLQNSGDGENRIVDGIEKERVILKALKKEADIVIDTSKLSIHDLSRKIKSALNSASKQQLKITVMSFGFKRGIPLDAEMMVDMRFLPNPFWIPELKELSGKDQAVSDYVFSSDLATSFIDSFYKTCITTFDGFLHENKSYLTIAFGCTGGKHRSVAMAEEFSRRLQSDGFFATCQHRDLGKE